MMATFCTLGTLEFDVLSWTSHTIRYAVEWAQHARISGKPRLEPVAESLMQVSVELAWHAYFSDPAAGLRALLAAQSAKRPLPMVFANGEHKGYFVITEVEDAPRAATHDNGLIANSAKVTLLEYAGEPGELPPAPAVLRTRVPLETVLRARQRIVIKPSQAPAVLANQALGFAATAKNALQTAKAGLLLAQTLQRNPVAALGQLPGLMQLMGQALPASNALAQTLTALGPNVTSAARMLPAAVLMAGQIKDARRNLQQARDGNSVAPLTGAASAVLGALDTAQTLQKPLSAWLLQGALRTGGL
jgi:hypothetical protein